METKFSTSIREQRKQDVVKSFYDSYKKICKDKPFVTQSEVLEHAVNSGAPRFYVTFENARRFISLLLRKKRLPITNRNKIAMYKEIFARYKERVKDTSERCKFLILEKIIEEPAPSFYLEEETFRGIVYKTLRSRNVNYTFN